MTAKRKSDFPPGLCLFELDKFPTEHEEKSTGTKQTPLSPKTNQNGFFSVSFLLKQNLSTF